MKTNFNPTSPIQSFNTEPNKLPISQVPPVIRSMTFAAFTQEFPELELASNPVDAIDFFGAGDDEIRFAITAKNGPASFVQIKGVITADEIVFLDEE